MAAPQQHNKGEEEEVEEQAEPRHNNCYINYHTQATYLAQALCFASLIERRATKTHTRTLRERWAHTHTNRDAHAL